MKRYFSPAERDCVIRTFARAEGLVGGFFGAGSWERIRCRYGVKTLVDYSGHTMDERAFARLFRCSFSGEDRPDTDRFLICLQDYRILDAVERGGSFVRLGSLLLYIATHELVHVIRFAGGEADFDADDKARLHEEGCVDSITRRILFAGADTHMKTVIECFDDRYHIGDIFSRETGAIQ